MAFKAFISGCATTALTKAERDLFAETRPCGLILFGRNVGNPGQVQALVSDFKSAVGTEDVLVLVDQEGGRVQRLRPPYWRAMPPARCFGDLYAKDREAGKRAAFAAARLMAAELYDLGINVDCTPCIDVPQEGAHDIIGDRAFSTDPEVVGVLGRAVMDGMLAGGVLPVIKHVPGHGRAMADSHKSLPHIDVSKEALEAVDFRPFHALRDAPLAMTAHVLLPVYDAQNPATLSPAIMNEVIRGQLGLTGLIMTDDIGMKALSGTPGDLTRAVIAGGCDVALHCSGKFDEMVDVAAAAPALSGLSLERFDRALACLGAPEPFDEAEALALVSEAAETRVAQVGPDPTVQA
ncbi:beta-hexosaminidase [Methyloceanibacter methanicus]|uniref:beta-N-acetylhexosaminidase n=1 Tax=Methyloceanibacter methanicus TaxID=1774968 RepID=A0A1E3VZG6_9HYPH|nr:beta-N-acetylhexosaminidase [Methyloceanibacter methanicus]ODR98938.1 beta-hexosaminidase [Methyloceanibacter methanicus]